MPRLPQRGLSGQGVVQKLPVRPGAGACGLLGMPGVSLPEIREKTRVRAFVEFLRRHGETALLDCLERNERAGLVYHYPGRLTGDYDVPETVEEILELIERGAGNP